MRCAASLLGVNFSATIRGADDPITITNFSRGDPTERGVQITIAAFLKDRFGSHLYRTAATLTAVALGLSQKPSHRVSRSAFSRSAFSTPEAAKRSRARRSKNDLGGRPPVEKDGSTTAMELTFSLGLHAPAWLILALWTPFLGLVSAALHSRRSCVAWISSNSHRL